MQIPILIEPAYADSLWARQTLEGMHRESARRKYETRILDSVRYRQIDYDGILDPECRMLVLLGTSLTWVPGMLDFMAEKNISTILLSFDPCESISLRGMVRMDYVFAMRQLLEYLTACGKKSIALYGINRNSSADMLKNEQYMRWQAMHNARPSVFFNNASLENCYREFEPCMDRFDAVICANDLVAVSLLERARSLKVPEEMFVTCFGNSSLAQNIRPSITCVTLDHEEVGRQAVKLFGWLYRQEPLTSTSLLVRSRLVIRESTAMLSPAVSSIAASCSETFQTSQIDFYADPAANRLLFTERMLSACNETDLRILQGLVRGDSNETMENALYISHTTLYYRLQRLMSIAECSTREEFTSLLRSFNGTGIFGV